MKKSLLVAVGLSLLAGCSDPALLVFAADDDAGGDALGTGADAEADSGRPESFADATDAIDPEVSDAMPADTAVVDALVDTTKDALADDGPCTPISHSNGLGQTYLDCAPLGTPGVASTYTVTMAEKARAAWPFAGVDEAWSCTGGPLDLLRRATGKGCAVWSYASIYAGRVDFQSSGECICSSSAPTWD